MNSKNRKIIQEIKEQTGIKDFRDGMLAAHFICRPLSRPCSVWFINHNVKPNQVTLLMILFGLVGSVLFALPNGVCKIIGYLFWILWFTMDLSDGQVARYTKIFSKYGTEMDYMAHLIDHPCMNIAIWLTFIQIGKVNPLYLSLFFMILISCELITRNLIEFDRFESKVNNKTVNIIDGHNRSWFKYILLEIVSYPTLIICISWLFIIDYYMNIGFSYWIIFSWGVCYFILFVKAYIQKLRHYYLN